MGELLQVEGVPQQPALYFEGAAGEIEARGVQGSDLVSGQCVDGGQGDHEAAERRCRLGEETHQDVGGDGLRDPREIPNREVPGGVAEDHSFAFECAEQAAQGYGQSSAGVAGQAVHGVVDVVLRDFPQ
ncbi:hypothetical protein CTU88_40490 [Streptomyces sp. JV178]|nr:hypothetical protein CTU88_40490 [Streptomyces sp. JV178]